jgi:hypothetical protein
MTGFRSHNWRDLANVGLFTELKDNLLPKIDLPVDPK